MVKVKVREMTPQELSAWGFNHPMVKVKGRKYYEKRNEKSSFNHPMVKVKVGFFKISATQSGFQPPYGES